LQFSTIGYLGKLCAIGLQWHRPMRTGNQCQQTCEKFRLQA